MPSLNDTLETLPYILAIIAGLGVLAFTVLYAWYANWRLTRAGRSVMYLASALSALLILVTTHLFIKDHYWGRDEIRLAVYLYLAWAGVQLPVALVKTLREHNPKLFSVFRVWPPRWRKSGRLGRSEKES